MNEQEYLDLIEKYAAHESWGEKNAQQGRDNKQRAMLQAYASGVLVRKIAEAAGLSERYTYKIIKREFGD